MKIRGLCVISLAGLSLLGSCKGSVEGGADIEPSAGTGAGGAAGSGQGRAGSETLGSSGGGADAAGSGGQAGAGGGSSVDVGPLGDCEFQIASELSAAIPSVGIVRWSVDLPALDSAFVEFGTDANYGMTAAVDRTEAEHRTLLLGMTPSTDYHFRIVVEAGDTLCRTGDAVIRTGPVENGLLLPSLVTNLPNQVEPGFLVTTQYVGSDGSVIYIFNQQGEIVWWYAPGITQLSRARMSWDGNSIYARDTNASGTEPGAFVRISMDGLDVETFELPTGHHDFTVTPDDEVVYIRKSETTNCDLIASMDAQGNHTPLFEVLDALPSSQGLDINEACHANSINYNSDDDTITFSELNNNAFVKITREGELVWVLGGADSDFSGEGAQWARQHGHHMLAPDRILFFNNGGLTDTGSSLALEVQLDLDAMTATRLWSYDSGRTSNTLGDVQELPGGNRLVTYSNAGVIHEVNPTQQIVQEWLWALGGAIGYVDHRPSLYGPPPKNR